MRVATALAAHPQYADPLARSVFPAVQQISPLVIAMADAFPVPVAKVAFKLEDVKILYEGIIPIDIVGRFPAQISEKAVAMMQIYRYHNDDVTSVNSEKRGRVFLEKCAFPSSFFDGSPFL